MEPNDNAALLAKTIAEHEATITSLKADNTALQQEFAKADTYEETVEVAKRAIADLLELSITTTRILISSADSESVRANLSKFVIDSVLSGKLDSNTDNSIRSLLSKLADNDNTFADKANSVLPKTS